MSTGATIVLVIVLVAVLAAVGWFVARQMRSRQLRERFGPEYDRRVQETDNRREAERELAERQKRHSRLELKPLPDEARVRYAEQWTLVQEQFVDRPGEAVAQAEALVDNVMRARGYPADGFEQQAADLSVEHGDVVGHYREGHAIRARHERAEMSTEELRRALVGYREVFVALVGVDVDGHHGGHRDAHRDGYERSEIPRARDGQEIVEDSRHQTNTGR